MRKTFIDRGGFWVLAQSALLTITAIAAILYREQFAPAPYQLYVALLLFALSAVTGIAGVVALGKNRTAFPHPLPASEIVSRGIYQVVRHPLYLSLMLWAISWALFWCSFVGIAFFVLIVIFFDLKARYEEHHLQKMHPEYTAYANRVRRFVPGIY